MSGWGSEQVPRSVALARDAGKRLRQILGPPPLQEQDGVLMAFSGGLSGFDAPLDSSLNLGAAAGTSSKRVARAPLLGRKFG